MEDPEECGGGTRTHGVPFLNFFELPAAKPVPVWQFPRGLLQRAAYLARVTNTNTNTTHVTGCHPPTTHTTPTHQTANYGTTGRLYPDNNNTTSNI